MIQDKILVFSDTHGSSFTMKAVLKDPPEGVTAVFHLGDGADEAERVMRQYPMYAFLAVKGNNDPFSRLPDIRAVERGGVRYFMTHGHKFSVKSTLALAAGKAAENGADVLLYGHTHIQWDTVVETAAGSVRAVNPGAGKDNYYAIITVDSDAGITVELMIHKAGGVR